MPKGGNNINSSHISSSVSFTARNDISSSGYYRVYAFIPENTYVYTTSNNYAELLLNVTKNGNTVLTKDITTFTGMIEIPSQSVPEGMPYNTDPYNSWYDSATRRNTISATSGNTTTDTWEAWITFVNLNSNQKNNSNKTMRLSLYFDTAPLLPEGYTEHKSITKSNGAYIDTGLEVYNKSDFSVDVRFKIAENAPAYNRELFSLDDDNGKIGVSPSTIYIGNLSSIVYSSLRFGNVYQYSISRKTGVTGLTHNLAGKNSVTTQDNLASVDGGNLYLLRDISNPSDSYVSIYNSKIYINDSLERNFVPCRNNLHVAGLYDTVYGVFYENANDSGNFVAGATAN